MEACERGGREGGGGVGGGGGGGGDRRRERRRGLHACSFTPSGTEKHQI